MLKVKNYYLKLSLLNENNCAELFLK